MGLKSNFKIPIPVSPIIKRSIPSDPKKREIKSIVVGSDFDEFKKSGLLIYFQEADGMYVNVITANHHDTYKLMEDSEDLWNLRDEPNRVFAEG